MRPAPTIYTLLGLALFGGSVGCQWGDRRVPPEDVLSIPGITVLDYDGLNVRVRCPRGSLGTTMTAGSQAREELLLRPGGQFTLSDNASRLEHYQILIATEERITLKRSSQTTLQRRADGQALRTSATVIAVPPYDHERERMRDGGRLRDPALVP